MRLKVLGGLKAKLGENFFPEFQKLPMPSGLVILRNSRDLPYSVLQSRRHLGLVRLTDKATPLQRDLATQLAEACNFKVSYGWGLIEFMLKPKILKYPDTLKKLITIITMAVRGLLSKPSHKDYSDLTHLVKGIR